MQPVHLLVAGGGAIAATLVIAFLIGSPGWPAIATGGVGLATLVALWSVLQRDAADRKALITAVETLLAGKAVDEETRRRSGELGHHIAELGHALRREQGLLKGVLAGLPTPFLLVDTNERVLVTNRETMEMLQIDNAPESQHGRTLAEVFYNDPTRQTAVGKSIATGQVFKNLEVTITGHKGGERHVLANVYPLYDLDGHCVGGFCLYLNMTELKARELELREQNELIASSAQRATAVAERLASAAEELSAQVEQTRAATETQRARTGETARAIDHMSAAIVDVARNAASTSELAQDARASAGDGATQMERAQRAIFSIRDQTSALTRDMSQLGDHAEKIGDVLRVITDIADQTNLLALNAAIEAARAGEAGRGFAVVADEVRKLAEKTMHATKEVAGVVQAIQTSSHQSRASTDAAAASVDEGVHAAAAAGEVIQAIVSIVEQTADRARDIAAAVEQQSAAGDEISAATGQVSHAADENAAAIEESAKAVSGLARMASDLKSIIEDMRPDALR